MMAAASISSPSKAEMTEAMINSQTTKLLIWSHNMLKSPGFVAS